MEGHITMHYTPIFLESCIVDTVLDFDLYMYNREKNTYVLYREQQTRFSDLNRVHLLRNNVSALFIAAKDMDKYHLYIEKNLGLIVNSPTLKTEEKANIIYQTARNVMMHVMEHPMAGESIQRSKRFVKNTVRYILNEKNYFFNIINLTMHDYYTYTHSINVCVYALALAHTVGINSPRELNILGTGALLHDIGKSTIPHEILLKRGPLTDEEWVTVKKHPEKGVEILHSHVDIDGKMFEIVRSHHEKLDGSGYPDKLTTEQIPFYAKIVCIADIFDALNTNRPYKQAADTFHSLTIMQEQFQEKIDFNLFRQFVLLFQQ